ncbi:hypothetical protein [Streptomyces sp. NBC_01006]|uniref:hypothetical protein n=1 Tax=Streptomyces sp. NBC_01006 TaxID=2903716 RepID=UPI0038641221|nr:hypothetical protein OG509_19415 [Streptomyces sp. NBC_01006]
MTQRLRAHRWLAGAAVAAAALSPATPVASAASATSAAASSPAGRVAAVRPPAAALPGRAPAAAPKTDDPDAEPVADVPHEAYEELAGSAAGVGRERPGRPAAEPANPETVLAARPLPARPRHRPASPQPVPPPPPSPPPVVTAIGTGPNERAADLAAHILPLGTGFALMGLGLGYLGMRLRKGL